jgi:glutamyl-Q tRNA(Asp) synthetase
MTPKNVPAVVGRFAPSPTGPLHLGSIVAALGSCLEARRQQGRWLVRIEDLDTQRCRPGTDRLILQTLEDLGFEWDAPLVWQTQERAVYESVFQGLLEKGLIYPCACSRKTVSETQSAHSAYPGTCRVGLTSGQLPRAWRLITDDRLIRFEDRIKGPQRERLSETCGDFVVKRADGFFAYHFAVVVDDARFGITEVVRGADLLESTARQCGLYDVLGFPRPSYAHLPLVLGQDGCKLSKQTGARDVREYPASVVLHDALWHLGQTPPSDLKQASVREIWAWAHAHWKLKGWMPSENAALHP